MGLWDRVKAFFSGAEAADPVPEEIQAPTEALEAPPEPPTPAPEPEPEPEPPAPPPMPLFNEEIEARIAEDTLNQGLYLEYSRWLRFHGDPRGDLIDVQHGLLAKLDREGLSSLENQQFRLLEDHWRMFDGPLPSDGFPELFWYMGFVRHINFDGYYMPSPEALRALLEHPSYRFVQSVWLGHGVTDAHREVMAQVVPTAYLGDDYDDKVVPVELAVRVEGEAEVVQSVSGLWGLRAFFIDVEWMRLGGHAFTTRTTASVGEREWVWWFGCSDGLAEEPVGDDPVRTGYYWFPAGVGGTVRLEVELLYCNFGCREDTAMCFTGCVEVSLVEGHKAGIILNRCPALTGAPFETTEWPEAEVVVGETFAEFESEFEAPGAQITGFTAVLPRIGVLDGDVLRRPGGDTSAAILQVAEGCMASYGYEIAVLDGGVVARIQREGYDSGGIWVSLQRLTGEDRVLAMSRFESGGHYFGQRFLKDGRLVLFGGGALVLFEPISGEEVRWPLAGLKKKHAEEREGSFSVHLHEGLLVVYVDGWVFSVDPDEGVMVEDPWEMRGLEGHWRQYGLGSCDYHPGPERLARIVCINDLRRRTALVWRDRSGEGGQVVVDDAGWAEEEGDRFGNLAVLEDGRIVAITNHVWLVYPDENRVERLGRAGRYQRPLLITRDEGRYRLWNRGPGPWFIEFD